MTKLLKKICMLGSPAVGKTSLVRRYVDQQFSEDYLSTIGVLISQKLIKLSTADVELILWDIEGIDLTGSYPMEYLMGSAAFIFVSDVTRPETFEYSAKLYRDLLEQFNLRDQSYFAINKCDLVEEDNASEAKKSLLIDAKVDLEKVVTTSAKADDNVTDLFEFIAREMVASFNM